MNKPKGNLRLKDRVEYRFKELFVNKPIDYDETNHSLGLLTIEEMEQKYHKYVVNYMTEVLTK